MDDWTDFVMSASFCFEELVVFGKLVQDFGVRTNPAEINSDFLFLHEKNYSSLTAKIASHYAFVKKYFIIPPPKKKSNELSRKSRVKGNDQLLKFNNTMEAYNYYTIAIGQAENSSVELAIAYANRSAVHFNIEEYEAVIIDVNRALSGPYPDNLKFKILERKAKCLVKIQNYTEATSAYKEALESIKFLNVSEVKKSELIDRIELEMKRIKGKKDVAKRDKSLRPKLTDLPSDTIYCASEAVKVASSTSMGRMVVAAKDIQPGDVLVVEKAYASSIDESHSFYFCYDCKKGCLSMLPCLNCTQVFYCDENCRRRSWDTEHMIECEIMEAINYVSRDELSPSCALKVLLKMTKQGRKLKNFIDKQEKYRRSNSPFPGFKNNKYSANNTSIANLGINKNRGILTVLKSSLLILALKKTTFFDYVDQGKDFIVGRLLSELIFKMLCNGARGSVIPKLRTLLPFSSLLNHSCDPNVFIFNCNDDLHFIMAISPISKGEQICVSYGFCIPLGQAMKPREFDCLCESCENNWPALMEMSMEDRHLVDKSVSQKLIDQHYGEFDLIHFCGKSEIWGVPKIDILNESHLDTLYRLSAFFKKYILKKPNPRLIWCKFWISVILNKFIIQKKSFKFK